jgi:hypothetical protein
MKDLLKSVGAIALGIVIFVAIAFIIGLMIEGASWASERLLPWFSMASVIGTIVLFLILLPLSLLKKTRGFGLASIMFLSYVFGLTLWMEGLLLTLAIWGVTAVIIGLFLGGIGVVPIAMVACLFHGRWMQLIELVILAVLTFGSRAYALWMEQRDIDAAAAADDFSAFEYKDEPATERFDFSGYQSNEAADE